MYTNRAHCRALRLMFALRKEQAYFINLNGICLRLRPKGVQGASGKPPASGMIRQLCRNQFPVGGIDAPTLARVVGLPPRGGKYFLSKRKKVPKKASGTATPEAAHVAMRRGLRSAGALRAVLDLGSLRSPAGKKPLIAHFAGGARYVARSMIGQISPAIRRAPNSPFSAIKMGGPFSLRCLSPPSPPQSA